MEEQNGQANHEPVEPPAPEAAPEPIVENQTTNCGNEVCQASYTFPVESNVSSFKYTCSKCGARNEWKRA